MKSKMVWMYSATVPVVDEKGKKGFETVNFASESDVPADATNVKKTRVKAYA